MEFINNETCDICHGAKTIKAKHNYILQVCPKCNGLGHIDWISQAMAQNTRNHNRQFIQDVAWQNINNMINSIKEQYYILGLDVDIQVQYPHLEFNKEKLNV